jgi:hypothetical protein
MYEIYNNLPEIFFSSVLSTLIRTAHIKLYCYPTTFPHNPRIKICLVIAQIKKNPLKPFSNAVLKIINAYWSYNRRKELLYLQGQKLISGV